MRHVSESVLIQWSLLARGNYCRLLSYEFA